MNGGASMRNVFDILIARKSTREYDPRIVPIEIVREVLKDAGRAPSSKNTQPWLVAYLSGQPLEELRRKMCGAFETGLPSDFEIDSGTFEAYLPRAKKLGKDIFAWKGIGREDLEKRHLHAKENFRFFGANQIFVVAVRKEACNEKAIFDVGLFSAYLMLALESRELGSCPQMSTLAYPQILRDAIPGSENWLPLLTLPFGYPKKGSHLNEFETEREPLGSWAFEVVGK